MQAPHQLLDLPPEILMGILRRVPNKMPIKLTCRQLYDTVCNLEAKRFRLVIKDENIKDYKMILRTTRIFDEVSIRIWSFPDFSVMRISEIFEKNKSSVTRISFAFTVINEGLLIQLLSLLPNLEEILLDVSLSNSSDREEGRLASLCRVRRLTCKVECARIIFELSDDLLTSLSFSSSLHDPPPSKKILAEIFQRQRKIEDLNFDALNVDEDSLETLNLKRLRLVSGNQGWKVLQKQRALIALELFPTSTLKEFAEVCQLKCLKCLVVDVRGIEPNLVSYLSNLNDLEELSICFEPLKQYCVVKQLLLPKLSSLELIHPPNFELAFDESSLLAVQLKSLKLTRSSLTLFNRILENENLKLVSIGSLTNCLDNSLKTNKIRSNLKHLEILDANDISSRLLVGAIRSQPNLRTIHLGNTIEDLEGLKIILMTCKRLNKIRVSNTKHILNLDHELIKLIKERGKNLMYFELGLVKFNRSEAVKLYKKHFECQFEFYELRENKFIMNN